MTVNETDNEGDNIYQTGKGWMTVGEQAIPGPKSLEQYAEAHEPQCNHERGSIVSYNAYPHRWLERCHQCDTLRFVDYTK